jgi:hypothetical protein
MMHVLKLHVPKLHVPERTRSAIAALVLMGSAGAALAALPVPAPTPAQQEAAAAKKAAAAAQAAQEKEKLGASVDALSARWRSRAASKGWAMHAPVTVAAAPAPGAAAPGAPAVGAPGAPGAPATAPAVPVVPPSGAVPAAVQTTGVAITGTPMPGVAPRATGVSANTITGTPAGNAAASPGNGAAPRSRQALESANVPIKSEKLGTATPSADIKNAPTKSVPKGASPAVDKGNAKEIKHE